MYAGISSSNPLSEGRFRKPSLIITAAVDYSMMCQHDEGDDLAKYPNFGWLKSPNAAGATVNVGV